jgi:membrane-bound lytic murein transglycosylase B
MLRRVSHRPRRLKEQILRALATALALALPIPAAALTCGHDASGFEAWKQDFARVAAANGIGQRGLEALAGARYSEATIRLDRAVRREERSFDEIWRVRGGDQLAARGREIYAANRAFLDALESRFGVPGYYLVAIHGWETNFGSDLRFVEIPIVSAILTVAYDCRRPEMFLPHALGALALVDQGRLDGDDLGAGHGEMGHTQFLPGNVLWYGIDGNGDGLVEMNDWPDAIASTANFIARNGWQPGAGYAEGQPNFEAMFAWNRGTNYRRGVARLAELIRG